jgi:chorismate synthase
LIGILEGMPAGLELSATDIQSELLRRKLGHGRSPRQGIESDRVQILSGVRNGRTLGSPIAVQIANADQGHAREIPLTVPRPGHADLAGARKFGFQDLRDVTERASARETAVRTALGAIAKRLLTQCGVCIASRVVSIGPAWDRSSLPCPISRLNALADASLTRSTSPTAARSMVAAIDRAASAGDTLGGTFEVWAADLPPGLGSYTHCDRRLDGLLAGALMSLNGIKAVAVGLGFEAADLSGSKVHDPYAWKAGRASYLSNRSGGIDGGMSTGEPLRLLAAMKPLPTLAKPLASVDLKTRRAARAPVLRSDICAVPAAAVISEALAALVLADVLLEKIGGDSMGEILPRLKILRRRKP